MSDLISRKAAIDAIINESNLTENKGDIAGLYLAVSMIEHLPSADRPTGWIPVSERLPKEYAQYLVYFKTGECYVYWLEDSDWSRSIIELEEIVAWMPLPEPYREDGE